MTRRPAWARRRPAPAPSSWPRLPSLDLLLQTITLERDKQLAHFDALDTKAGVLHAFDGMLITLARVIRVAFQRPGILLASASAFFALRAVSCAPEWQPELASAAIHGRRARPLHRPPRARRQLQRAAAATSPTAASACCTTACRPASTATRPALSRQACDPWQTPAGQAPQETGAHAPARSESPQGPLNH